MTNLLKNKIINYYKHYYKDTLNIPNWADLTNKQLSEETEELERIKYLEKLLGKFKNKKILDIGCGTGGFVAASNLKGARAVGIEPDEKAIEICRLKKCKVIKSTAENLPFKDNQFDIIHCHTVIEHVKDVEKSILEIVRVAKKNGIIYIKCPNYLSFYEGHYKIFWLPLFPKTLSKSYLKIRKRPTEFIDTINYDTPNLFKSIFNKHKIRYKFLHQPIKLQNGLINFLIYIYQKVFNVPQNIEIIIKKKYVG